MGGFPGGCPVLLSPPSGPALLCPAPSFAGLRLQLLLDRELFGEEGDAVTRIEVI